MPRRERLLPRAFLFADLRGYTAYVERAGDAAASRLLRRYRDLVRRAIAKAQGAEIKTEGDSFYVVFDSSAAAVHCAMTIQRGAARHRGEPLRIGIGIHAGEATPFDTQYVGSAVNIAARLAATAGPGEVLVSDTVRGLIRTAVRVPFEDRGLLVLKGIREPVRAYAIRGVPAAEGPAIEAPPTGAMQAIMRGDLDGAIGIVRAASHGAPTEARCDALTALSLLAAARGDVETALGRTEELLPLALRAADRSWVRVVYALRSWLYFLARQPGEGQAELDRALERAGTSADACLALLLAMSLGGSAAHADRLRDVAGSCADPGVGLACGAVADALEGRPEGAAAPGAVADAGGPFLGPILELQLTAWLSRQVALEVRSRVARRTSDRLVQLVLEAVQ